MRLRRDGVHASDRQTRDLHASRFLDHAAPTKAMVRQFSVPLVVVVSDFAFEQLVLGAFAFIHFRAPSSSSGSPSESGSVHALKNSRASRRCGYALVRAVRIDSLCVVLSSSLSEGSFSLPVAGPIRQSDDRLKKCVRRAWLPSECRQQSRQASNSRLRLSPAPKQSDRNTDAHRLARHPAS